MRHVVMFSGGVGSWAAAKRVTAIAPLPTLLFADTLMEDEDLYRFIEEAAANVGGELVKVAEGRDPWQVFSDEKYLGNTRIDPCSKILKRQFLRRWLERECNPAETIVYLGIDWTEEHRFIKAQKYWAPWTVRAPLCDPPYVEKDIMLADLEAAGIVPPRLYAMGFPHNNCGGFCIKAGQAHFRLLLEKMPERYDYHARKEQEIRKQLGKDVAILRDRTGGTTKPLTLVEFRRRILGGDGDDGEWGGCGCFSADNAD